MGVVGNPALEGNRPPKQLDSVALKNVKERGRLPLAIKTICGRLPLAVKTVVASMGRLLLTIKTVAASMRRLPRAIKTVATSMGS
ncbi:hypothetical protein SUGI_0339620 [Cryptomeria japonica]|nr:hypothetical protein SUGI_0339620 [Cryptomeria japonica]